MKNSLTDLNNHLFAQLERLGDEDITPEQLEKEIRRAESMQKIADKIITNADLVVKAEKLKAEYGSNLFHVPKLIKRKNEN